MEVAIKEWRKTVHNAGNPLIEDCREEERRVS